MRTATAEEANRITELVELLDWECVREECHFIWWVGVEDSNVYELREFGTAATPELIAALIDPERAVPSNLILWHIWCPPSEDFPFVTYASELPFRYQTGKLHWTSSTRDKFDIPSEMLKANQDWWRQYVAAHGR